MIFFTYLLTETKSNLVIVLEKYVVDNCCVLLLLSKNFFETMLPLETICTNSMTLVQKKFTIRNDTSFKTTRFKKI